MLIQQSSLKCSTSLTHLKATAVRHHFRYISDMNRSCKMYILYATTTVHSVKHIQYAYHFHPGLISNLKSYSYDLCRSHQNTDLETNSSATDSFNNQVVVNKY